jgi:uncharacterized protein YifN (PemK superfamily)
MAINFHPKAGMVLRCDFRGSGLPEIPKIRPVVVITPNHIRRASLALIVPLSTQSPHRACAYQFLLSSRAFPGATADSWAKCDLDMTVSHARLDRIRLPSGKLVTGFVSDSDLKRIYRAVAHVFGLDARKACE